METYWLQSAANQEIKEETSDKENAVIEGLLVTRVTSHSSH